MRRRGTGPAPTGAGPRSLRRKAKDAALAARELAQAAWRRKGGPQSDRGYRRRPKHPKKDSSSATD